MAALIFAIGIGIPLGYFAARRYGSWLDNLSVSGSLLGVAVPVFFLAYILKYVRGPARVAADRRPPGPADGRGAPDRVLRAGRDHHRQPEASLDAIVHLILPAIALGPSRWRSSCGSPVPACSTW